MPRGRVALPDGRLASIVVSMTDRPSDDGRRARSEAASRLAALLADATDDQPSPAPSDPPLASEPASPPPPATGRRGPDESSGPRDVASPPTSRVRPSAPGDAEDAERPGEGARVGPTGADGGAAPGESEGEVGGSGSGGVAAGESGAGVGGGESGGATAGSTKGGRGDARAQAARGDAPGGAASRPAGAANGEETAQIDMSSVLAPPGIPDRPSTSTPPSAAGPRPSTRLADARSRSATVLRARPGAGTAGGGAAPTDTDPADAPDRGARRSRPDGVGSPVPSRPAAAGATTAWPAERGGGPKARATTSKETSPPSPRTGATKQTSPPTSRTGASKETSTPPKKTAEPPPEGQEPRLSRITLRSVSFAVAFIVFLAAVPVLGWVGKERLLDSRGGNVVDASTRPTDPGYRALVDPTQTALVIQRPTAEGDVVAATLLSLGMGQTGGTVLQVPLNTKLATPAFTLDRLAQGANGPVERLVGLVAARLNVAIPNTIELDDERLAQLVAPVAPLTVDNPDPVVLDSGEQIDAGPVSLEADQLGPFLRAGDESESELGRLARNEVVWAAWLDAIDTSDTADSVGPATTGIGPFLRTLAAGDPAVETLDVSQETDVVIDDPNYVTPLVPAPGFEEQIIDAVPFPRSPGAGGRYNLQLLNGASGEPIPRPLVRDLILRGAALSTLGNASDFGQEETTIEYSNEDWKDLADVAAETLGGATVTQMSDARAEAVGDDIVITLGQEAIDRYGQ